MRRLTYLAACSLFLFLAVPLWAQHGGGGHAGGGGGGHAGGGFGGHAGFSGGSHISGGHASGGMRSGAIHSSPGVSRGFAHGPTFAQRGFSQRGRSNGPFLHNDFRGPRFRTYRTGNCWGYSCRGYYDPYYGGFYDPYWWWDSNSSYDQDYQDNLAQADQMNQESLAEQAEEQRMLRQEQADGDRDIYARSAAPPREETLPQPPTLLIFHDQHKQEVHNYAIVGQTLWSFGQHTEKIPLADLDLAATVKANDERGLTFHVPASVEGQ
jgi:hypothetical protein